MNQSEVNKNAWSYRAYEFWLKYNGTPEEVAKEMKSNPQAWLHRHLHFLGDVCGKKIANLLGSNGRKAIPLALLGADVTIVDISEENKRYALELAHEAGVTLRYIVSDLKEIDIAELCNQFDIAYLEGGVLHYFEDLNVYFRVIYDIMKTGGKLILSDSHPIRKILKVENNHITLDGDYFDNAFHADNVAYKTQFPSDEQKDFPDCLLRFWTLGEIITSLASVGFVIHMLNEEPRWDIHKNIPGTYTLIAHKR